MSSTVSAEQEREVLKVDTATTTAIDDEQSESAVTPSPTMMNNKNDTTTTASPPSPSPDDDEEISNTNSAAPSESGNSKEKYQHLPLATNSDEEKRRSDDGSSSSTPNSLSTQPETAAAPVTTISQDEAGETSKNKSTILNDHNNGTRSSVATTDAASENNPPPVADESAAGLENTESSKPESQETSEEKHPQTVEPKDDDSMIQSSSSKEEQPQTAAKTNTSDQSSHKANETPSIANATSSTKDPMDVEEVNESSAEEFTPFQNGSQKETEKSSSASNGTSYYPATSAILENGAAVHETTDDPMHAINENNDNNESSVPVLENGEQSSSMTTGAQPAEDQTRFDKEDENASRRSAKSPPISAHADTVENGVEETTRATAETPVDVDDVMVIDEVDGPPPRAAAENAANEAQDSAKPPPAAKRPPPPEEDVIDLLDSDDDDSENNSNALPKKPRLNANVANPAAVASYQARASHMPLWMQHNKSTAQSIERMYLPPPQQPGTTASTLYPPPLPPPPQYANASLNEPIYEPSPPNFKPTWRQLTPNPPLKPPPQQQLKPGQTRVYQLSLLNVNEFTIEGLSARWDLPPTSISGLRAPIRRVSRKHGKSVYERDKEGGGGGKWRIPLGAYHDFASYLSSEPNTVVHGIPPNQLQIASLERARKAKGYPDPEKLVEYGVPAGVANALAPFQRGGVDFVKEKGGRALIADDMGLGKTIQGVASMSIYMDEWPVLVLCPSGARYHWENEFKQWLGVNSSVNKKEKDEETDKTFPDCKKASSDKRLLQDWQINVLTSSKSPVFPHSDTKVVICSYGLAPALVESGKLYPRLFRCAIVDESHMLKNKATKRTSTLLPVLNATNRCVLLSGTPALARPLELWPQLAILGTEQHGWGSDEGTFLDKYVKNGSSRRSAELHTMLTGTVMIRRLKNDIMKSLPKKRRERAEVHVMRSEEQRNEFKNLLVELRKSKGALGTLARTHHVEFSKGLEEDGNGSALLTNSEGVAAAASQPSDASPAAAPNLQQNQQKAVAETALNSEIQRLFIEGRARIQQSFEQQAAHLLPEQRANAMQQMEDGLRVQMETYRNQKMNEINSHHAQQRQNDQEETKRTTLLSKLYGLTGDAKIPLVVDMLKRWLKDPTKGKICIFAHHISVLNAIRDGVGLTLPENKKSDKKHIRIDGSTLPRHRQEQITAFQNDPSIRVALLGITAAGVAVTLTASSTVWFAELFWTPAIMIQAEDRCHRIGQQARVDCLYFVARGTLDDVLWKLIEKKFQDLGEFVEGKEKLKMVVDKTYKGAHELHSSMFVTADESGSDEEEGADDADFNEELQLDSDLLHDLEELGEEERRMLQEAETDEAEGDPQPIDLDTKMPAAPKAPEIGQGQTEDDAILLDDDDEPEAEARSSKAVVTSASEHDRQSKAALTVEDDDADTAAKAAQPSAAVVPANALPNERDERMADCRSYKLIFTEPRLGLEITLFEGRAVVASILKDRSARLGPNSKPAVGDILVSIGIHGLPLVAKLDQIVVYLKYVLQKPPVSLTFVEAPRFAEHFKKVAREAKAAAAARAQENGVAPTPQAPAAPPPSNGGVIDLIDDD